MSRSRLHSWQWSFLIVLTFCFYPQRVSASEGSTLYEVSSSAAVIEWYGRRAYTRGGHFGIVGLKSGTVGLDKGGRPNELRLVIDMASLEDRDLIQDPGMKEKLEAELKSADFFDVGKYPEASYAARGISNFIMISREEATRLGFDGLALDGSIFYKVVGQLTVKGRGARVGLLVAVLVSGTKVRATGQLVFDRTRFNIRYRSGKYFPNLGDKMIADNILLKITSFEANLVDETIAPLDNAKGASKGTKGLGGPSDGVESRQGAPSSGVPQSSLSR